MQIALDYTPAVRQGAGIGRYTRGLVEALAEIDRENQYVLFCAGRESSRTEWPANFRIRRSAIPARWLTAGWHKMRLPLPAEALVGRCDLYHSPDFVLPPLWKARGVVTVHDLTFMRFPDCADPGLRAYLSQAVPRAVSAAHLVLADSPNTRDDLVDLLQVPPTKISVVPAAVDAMFKRVGCAERLEQARAKYRLPPKFILSVGTIEPRKNYARLVSAYALMRRRALLPHDLVIAGKPGWLYEEVFERVREEAVGEFVHFLGFVPDEDLPALYTLGALLVFPSLYEGFGLPPLEAMACGTPVVCSDNSSLPSSVGDAALTVNAEDLPGIADAMIRVLTDDRLRAKLVERGAIQAAKFTWEAAARRLLGAYRQAMSMNGMDR